MTEQATQAVIVAARELVRSRRWYLDLDTNRDLPDPRAAALEQALIALETAEPGVPEADNDLVPRV